MFLTFILITFQRNGSHGSAYLRNTRYRLWYEKYPICKLRSVIISSLLNTESEGCPYIECDMNNIYIYTYAHIIYIFTMLTYIEPYNVYDIHHIKHTRKNFLYFFIFYISYVVWNILIYDSQHLKIILNVKVLLKFQFCILF